MCLQLHGLPHKKSLPVSRAFRNLEALNAITNNRNCPSNYSVDFLCGHATMSVSVIMWSTASTFRHGIVGSNPTCSMNVCLIFICSCVVVCRYRSRGGPILLRRSIRNVCSRIQILENGRSWTVFDCDVTQGEEECSYIEVFRADTNVSE